MENISTIRIQIISIGISLCFLLYIARLMIKGRLREEYSIVWIISTIILILFSFWRQGLEIMAQWLGVYSGLNLAFAGAIFAILIYLLHLSIVISRLQEHNKSLAQNMAILKDKLNEHK